MTSNIVNCFTGYLRITEKNIILVTIAAGKNSFNLSAYIYGHLNKNKLVEISRFLNATLKKADEENEWENFKFVAEKVCEREGMLLYCYKFITEGGTCTPRNAIIFLN